MLVVGNPQRIGETARNHLLVAKAERHPKVRGLLRHREWLLEAERVLQAALEAKRRSMRPRSRAWTRAWRAFVARKYRLAAQVAKWCQRMATLCGAVGGRSALEAEADVMRNADIILCTIASTVRLLREWEEKTGEQLMVHTVIVDECGCTAESSMGMLLRLRPRNLILVGDHKQLPPVSMCPPSQLGGTGHTRSLLERCILASGRVHRLREQYRMHPTISDLVSGLFYGCGLLTPKHVIEERALGVGTPPIVWLAPEGGKGEVVGPAGRSYVNYEEAESVVAVARRLRLLYPGSSIAVITMYKGQLLELMRLMPAGLGVEVLTVDSCQGSEFEYVIVSTVRSNYTGKIGFLSDKQRICVALSRCMRRLFLVGDNKTLASNNADWRKVELQASFLPLASWCEPPAAGGHEESLLDALKSTALTGSLAVEQHAGSPNDPDSALRLMRGQASFGAPGGGGGKQGGKTRSQGAPAKGRGHGRESEYSTSGRHSNRRGHPMEAGGGVDAIELNAAAFPSLPVSTTKSHSTEEEVFQRDIAAALAASQAMVPPAGAPHAEDEGWDVTRESLFDIFPDTAVVEDVLARFADCGMAEAEAIQRSFVVLTEMSDEVEEQEVDDLEWDYTGLGHDDEEDEGSGGEEDALWEGKNKECCGQIGMEGLGFGEGGPGPPAPGVIPGAVSTRTTRYGSSPRLVAEAKSAAVFAYREQESALREMGFENQKAVQDALTRCKGDVAATIEALANNVPGADGPGAPPEPTVREVSKCNPADSLGALLAGGDIKTPGVLLRHGLALQGLDDTDDVAGYVMSVLESMAEEEDDDSREDTMHALVQLLVAEGAPGDFAAELLAMCAAMVVAGEY